MSNTTDAGMEMLSHLFAGVRIVDLGALLENEAPIWPTHPPLIIHPTITHERHGYFTNTIFMPEHVGTHCDAPAHADPTQPDFTIDTYPIDAMIGPACIINVADRNLEAGEVLTETDILAWEAENGEIRKGEIVLINFGWYARHWKVGPEARYYASNQPGLDESAVRLIYERGAKALGSDNTNVESPIVDGVFLNPGYAHAKYFLPNGLPLIESLINLEQLPPRCWFIALPLKIKHGSGSPIRPIALVANTP